MHLTTISSYWPKAAQICCELLCSPAWLTDSHSSTELWDHQSIVSPNDVASMRACAERIAAAHRANVKICRLWTKRGTEASDGSDFAADT